MSRTRTRSASPPTSRATTSLPSGSGTSSYLASHAPRSSSGYSVNPVRELGLELEQRQYNTRLLALTKPAEYATARQSEFVKLTDAVEQAYKSSYDGFTDAGMPHDMAKSYALAAANAEKQVRRQVLETLFPSGANLIGDAAMVRSMTGSIANLEGTGGQAPRRRRAAPRKRAAPRRRR